MQRYDSHPLRRPGRLGALLLAVLMIGALAAQPALSLAQDGSSLEGSYTVTIGREDIPTDLADGYSFAGRWIITFGPNGEYTGERQDVGVAVTGSYVVDGNEITITDESGLVSCANPVATTIRGGDIASGTYEWAMIGSNLTLVAIEDGCVGRSVLLSTRPLAIFVPCETAPLGDEELIPGANTPEAGTEIDEIIPADETEDDPLSILTPDDPVDSSGEEIIDGDPAAIGAEIDELLAQMTACWSTGNPDLWLPLLSEDFRASLLQSSPDFASTIGAAMATPILWERAGDIDIESPTRVTAIVRSTIALEQDFQRFAFVLEDGEWRWDG
jgi:hypothetical protein